MNKLKTLLSLTISVILIGSLSQAESDEQIYVGRSTGTIGALVSFFTGKEKPLEIKSTYSGSQAPSVLVYDGSSRITAMGRPAEYLARALAPQNKKIEKPVKPLRYLVVDENKQVLATINEVLSGSKIFSVARHVLLGLDNTVFLANLAEQGLDLSQYGFYEFLDEQLQKLDVVWLIPNQLASQMLDVDQLQIMRLRPQSQYASRVSPNDSYFSYQIGFLNNKVVEQISKGVVQRADNDDFYLDIVDGNDSVPRSSGSLVYTQSQSGSIDQANKWRLAGSISCLIPSRETKVGHPIRGAVKVVSMKSLLAAQVLQSSLEEFSHAKRTVNPDCLPMDPRDGGE